MELIEPKAPLFAYGCWGALYKYLNTIQYKKGAWCVPRDSPFAVAGDIVFQLRLYSEVSPHQAGTAYISRAIVIALVTVCSAASGSPLALSTRRAKNDLEQTERRFSTLFEAWTFSLTLRMLSDATRMMPRIRGGLALPLLVIIIYPGFVSVEP